jgi:hypothetical protein
MSQDSVSHDERRRAPRHDYDCAVLIARGAEGFLGQIENVSATGCCVTRPHDWTLAVASEVILYLLIDGRHVFGAPARVVWANAHSIGFEYLEPQPLPPAEAPLPT